MSVETNQRPDGIDEDALDELWAEREGITVDPEMATLKLPEAPAERDPRDVEAEDNTGTVEEFQEFAGKKVTGDSVEVQYDPGENGDVDVETAA